jgi:hypothetical protein
VAELPDRAWVATPPSGLLVRARAGSLLMLANKLANEKQNACNPEFLSALENRFGPLGPTRFKSLPLLFWLANPLFMRVCDAPAARAVDPTRDTRPFQLG